jgi:DNA-binding response OmpR family regulator
METILLVEDERDLARIVARELEMAGYRVQHVVDGHQALQAQASHKPDLVILDWMLPGLDGLEVLRRIRQASAVPVLVLTARGEEMDRVVGLEVGADDYLTKPFSMRQLIARVRALLRRISHVQQILEDDRRRDTAAIQYAGLCLELRVYQATLDGQPLELTRRVRITSFSVAQPGAGLQPRLFA